MMGTHIAIFSSHGLGDGLIQLTMANNFLLNGYRVTYFSDYVSQLRDYIPEIIVLPFPKYAEVISLLADVNIILYDSNSGFVRQLPEKLDSWFSENGIAYSLSRFNPKHKNITVKKIEARLDENERGLASRFIKLNCSFRKITTGRNRLPMACHLSNILKSKIGLKSVTCENGIRIKQANNLDTGKIIIHPDSSSVKKNWLPEQFVALAENLKSEGWNPVFTVAPDEQMKWLEIVEGRFDVPVFDSIKSLAEYYATSVAFIGNDSGNAHLASSIGLPSLVIYNRWRKNPPWRPAWGCARVIYPHTLIRKNWQQKVSVDNVLTAYHEMMGLN